MKQYHLGKLALLLVLSGCKASTTALPYENFESTAAETSVLGGNALQKGGDVPVLVAVTGSFTHNTKGITLNDGTYQFADAKAPVQGVYTDGISKVFWADASGITGLDLEAYDYVTVYRQTYPAGGENYETSGVIGIVTRPQDMPTGGIGFYTGNAVGTYKNTGQVDTAFAGTATLRAKFDEGIADLGIFDIDVRSGQVARFLQFDELQAFNMPIQGNAFSSNAVTVKTFETSTNVTGPNTTSEVGGRFFALSESGIPDEVGGRVLVKGDTGAIDVLFVGD